MLLLLLISFFQNTTSLNVNVISSNNFSPSINSTSSSAVTPSNNFSRNSNSSSVDVTPNNIPPSPNSSQKPVRYSREELESIANKLSKKMPELGINCISIDGNRVKVYLDKIDNLKISNIKNIVDSPAIEFIGKENTFTLT